MKTVYVEIYGKTRECWMISEISFGTIEVEVKESGKCYRVSGVKINEGP